jgi:drug/metabolite transporter (DMT)-like permease
VGRRFTRRQWLNALAIGTLLLACGNGGVAIAEQTVSSGLAALMVSAMPLWMAVFGGLWGRWPAIKDWIALAIGFGGILILNLGSELRGSTGGVAALMFATAAWAFGSLWSRRLDLPKGMIGRRRRDVHRRVGARRVQPAPRRAAAHRGPGAAVAAIGYLVVFGLLVAYTAYLYLLARAPAPVASSYAYVNPLVALALGAAFYGENLPQTLLVSVPLILTAVALVLRPTPDRVAVPVPALRTPRPNRG